MTHPPQPGAGGHAAVTEHRPEVAVVDNHLPDGSGVGLCRRLCLDVPATSVVLHSGAMSSAENREALEAGAAAVVSKSVTGQSLVQAIHRLGLLSPAVRPPARPAGPGSGSAAGPA